METAMIKVFFVEDEYIIRKSIRENIDWAKEGFVFCGEAGDGELALPLIRQEKPDILITDVKMPFMDGLELAGLVKKEFPSMKILILSGFRDFDFAKKAISIGVTDYLSKPITSERLLEAVKQVAARIENEREEASLLKTYQKEMAGKYVLERNQFFNNLLERQRSVTDLIIRGRELGLELSAPYYGIFLCKFMQREDTQEAAFQVQEVSEKAKEAFQQEPGLLVFERGFDGFALLIESDISEKVSQTAERVSAVLKSIATSYPLVQFFGGIGCTVNRLSELSRSYLDANKAFASRFFTTNDQIVAKAWAGPVHSMPAVDPPSLSWHHLEDFYASGTEEEIPGFCEQYLASVGEKNCEAPTLCSYVAMNVYYCSLAIPFIASLSKEKLAVFGPAPISVLDAKTMENYVERIITLVITERDQQANRKYFQQMVKAKQYIAEHVREYGLSLNTVAEYIHMSPNYFSSVFSKEEGKTFIEFLTERRMQKAKELLMSTTMRPSDIAQEVGYQDSHYFGYLFKKLVGCTPKEFRDRG